ncbi:AlwI family type II restriction endonuclease [Dermacoccus nishinomiyaensis]|uniref:AlwI family type II restriction endonuclease n=1 Tax=Dermacoccus nishinomiyaensis TaxID=1274 RepID=UPI001F5045DD|nr:AlwI family type II restriction endonuclease [Dermacoccus nishinomiyaensis]MCI0154130.1 AlwI family type II restriction endonuclease [Dermacoccus nishinomiyaensis]
MQKAQEEKIALALAEAGVVSLASSTNDITSIARKWRSVLVKLGFLWPDVEMLRKEAGISQSDIGAPFTLTPNGRRLLGAKSFQGEQEVLLRSLAALRLPSPLEPAYDFVVFSPLVHVVRVLETLEEAGHAPYISRLEMASIVILSNASDDLEVLVNDIADQRRARSAALGKRRFDAEIIRAIAEKKGQKYQTLYDYQDVSFRYLKATGLFQSRGRGITLVPEKRRVATLLAVASQPPATAVQYLNLIAEGAKLPTDTQGGAQEVLVDLISIASERRIDFDSSSYDLSTPEGVSLARHDLEQAIFEAKELEYAADQRGKMNEILAYLQMLDKGQDSQLFGDEQLVIPREERPAYFEWLLWRVVLALNHLTIPPSEVRRFHIDQDFLPVSTASGGGADVIAEYRHSVLVVEVTLTESSRQEAAEGEPVRRHVADVLERFEPAGKDVYGLFVARRIDTNTAETFRIGAWYKKDDERVSLDVVPLTLAQLTEVLRAGAREGKLTPSLLLDVISKASLARAETRGAPEWKTRIAEIVAL